MHGNYKGPDLKASNKSTSSCLYYFVLIVLNTCLSGALPRARIRAISIISVAEHRCSLTQIKLVNLAKIVFELLRHVHGCFDMFWSDKDATFFIFVLLGFGEGNGDLKRCDQCQLTLNCTTLVKKFLGGFTIPNFSSIPPQRPKLFRLYVIFSRLQNTHSCLPVLF